MTHKIPSAPKTKRQARALLIRAGIFTKAGNLSGHYYTDAERRRAYRKRFGK